jgi:SprT protein
MTRRSNTLTSNAAWPLLAPITPVQQQQVVAATEEFIARASQLLQREIATIPVLFNLRGRAAGMYWHKQGVQLIRYNPWLFAKYFEDNLRNTVPHEVAHYLSDRLYGLRAIRPHGKEWRALMQLLGASPEIRHNYDLQGIPQRRQQRFTYRCGCRSYELGTVRHRRIASGRGYYQCRHCAAKLTYAGTNAAAELDAILMDV